MRKVLLATVAVVGLGNTVAHADILGLDFIGPPPFIVNTSEYNLGYRFSVNNNITLTGLGIFDNGSFGTLPQPQQVGLWDSHGNLLASAFVFPGPPSEQIGEWAFSSISPITLTAGMDYVVGGQGFGPYTGAAPVIVDPDITYLFDLQVPLVGANPPLTEPISSDGFTTTSSAAWFGGNIEFTTATTTVPEPATLALLGVTLAAMGLARRRKLN